MSLIYMPSLLQLMIYTSLLLLNLLIELPLSNGRMPIQMPEEQLLAAKPNCDDSR